MSQCYLAVNIGGTRLAAAVVDDNGDVLIRDRVKTPVKDVWPALRRLVLRVMAAAPSAPVSCGVGSGGPMEPDAGTVSPLHIPTWHDFPIVAELETVTKLPVVIDIDAKAATMGEAWCGAAANERNFIGVVLGAGIGGGILSNGRLLRGRLGNAGHIGHVVVEPEGRECPCGGRGCLEAYCSGSAIEAETGRSPLRAPPAIIERSGLLLGRALAAVATVCDLQMAVVGGTIALNFGEPFFAAANAEVRTRAKLGFIADFTVVPSMLGSTASLIGAAALARQLVGAHAGAQR